ncbi:MAG: hypothetical protein JW714_04100 [Candidatus Omnitrophica bacterium]|nr:hypothetical protein [Candidatus Omnitrophota bacterium]
MIKKSDNPNGNAHRVVAFLTRDEIDFLDKISKDALFSVGNKLSRSKIISAIVNVIRKLQIDGRGLSSKKELEAKVLKAITQMSQETKKPQQNHSRGDQNERVL